MLNQVEVIYKLFERFVITFKYKLDFEEKTAKEIYA